jgi:hypothetical protein
VIATNGGGFDAGELDDLVLKSINSYITSEDYSSKLIQKIDALRNPHPENKSKESFPDKILNKNFQIETNDIGITTLRFEQKNSDYYIILKFSDGSQETHPIGMDNQYIISNERVLGLPIGVKGFWDNDILFIKYNEFSRINMYNFKFTFYKNSVDFDFQDQTNNRNVLLRGIIEN